MNPVLRFLNRHFEAAFLGYLWVNSCVLAALVGRPWLGAIGAVTVLPFLAAYAWRVRSGPAGSRGAGR